jgi:hypothetical protein
VTSAVGPGDRIRCIRADHIEHDQVVPPNVYTVHSIARGPGEGGWFCQVCNEHSDEAIHLIEFRRREYQAWCMCCFEPTWESDGDFLAAIRERTPQRV